MKNFFLFIYASKFDKVLLIFQQKYKWITLFGLVFSIWWCPVDISIPSRYSDMSIFSFCFNESNCFSFSIALSMEIFAFKSIFCSSINEMTLFKLRQQIFNFFEYLFIFYNFRFVTKAIFCNLFFFLLYNLHKKYFSKSKSRYIIFL